MASLSLCPSNHGLELSTTLTACSGYYYYNIRPHLLRYLILTNFQGRNGHGRHGEKGKNREKPKELNERLLEYIENSRPDQWTLA
jgi:hypothetical protein